MVPRQANKLSTVKKCLEEVLKYGGPFSPRDLYPVRFALHALRSLSPPVKNRAEHFRVIY